MLPEEKKKAGEEANMLARRALEIDTKLHGTESRDAASDMLVLANILDYFGSSDDGEVLRLYEQAVSIFTRLEGRLSPNVMHASLAWADCLKRESNSKREQS